MGQMLNSQLLFFFILCIASSASSGVVEHINPTSNVKVKVDVEVEVNHDHHCGSVCKTANQTEEARVRRWLWEEFYPEFSPLTTKCWFLTYAWNTDITDKNKDREDECLKKKGELLKRAFQTVSKFDLKSIKDEIIMRQIKEIINIQMEGKLKALEGKDFDKLVQVYSTAKICPFEKQDCNPETDPTWTIGDEIKTLLGSSRSSNLLEYIWTEFHRAVGQNMTAVYAEHVKKSMIAVEGSGFPDYGAKSRDIYDADGGSIKDTSETIWKELLPLYEELYSHVRRRLSQLYPSLVDRKKPIPAHLLGHIMAHTWTGLYSDMRPFNMDDGLQSKSDPIEEAMKEQNYTVLKMFQTSEEFFKSLGFPSLPSSFYDLAMMEKSQDPNKKVVCHPTAWDMYNGLDFMIKQCSKVNSYYLRVIHHEMGHVYYFMAYKIQPVLLRDGANPAFHEAVGDTMMLSSTGPKYLQKIGLMEDAESNYKMDLNHLMKEALDHVALLPFGYLVDLWRWDIYENKLPVDQWNHHWWNLRYKYQGVTRPSPEKPDVFDPVAKYHVAGKIEFIRYFISRTLIFQFHKQLCNDSGHVGPLHECSFYGSKNAGKRLWKMFELGRSKPWPEALKVMIGNQPISAEPLKEFFKPLMNWLKAENAKYEDNCYGWGQSWPGDYNLPKPRCPEKDFPE